VRERAVWQLRRDVSTRRAATLTTSAVDAPTTHPRQEQRAAPATKARVRGGLKEGKKIFGTHPTSVTLTVKAVDFRERR
jgi:hypothetical protein